MSDAPARPLRRLPVEPLTREAFRPFGDLLDASGTPDHSANGGAAEVFRELAALDVGARGGRACVSIVRAAPSRLPLQIRLMERHPLGSQAFAPLGAPAWLIVAAPAGPLDPRTIRAFSAAPNQGVNYRRGVWHHPLIALGQVSDFLVVDRAGDGENLTIETLAEPLEIISVG